MKRIAPTQNHPDAHAYPSLVDCALPESAGSSRRVFLKGAAAVCAGLAGGLLAGARERTASAAPAGKAAQRIPLPLKSRYRFQHGNYELQRAVAQTGDAGLGRFLSEPKEAARIEAALRKVLDRHSCVDLLDGKRLARLQIQVGDALTAVYRQRTGRAAPRPTVVLFVGVPAVSCLGDCAPPTPVCRPPRP